MRLITRKVSRTDAYKVDINGSIPSNEEKSYQIYDKSQFFFC